MARRGPPEPGPRGVAASPQPGPDRVRPARPTDAEAIAAIHNQGIAERVATFETGETDPGRVAELIEHRILYLVHDGSGGVDGFAKVGSYEDRSRYYDGVGEATIFVERGARRGGVGRSLLDALAEAAAERGYHKLTAKVIADNEPSLRLFAASGFRTVGTHRRHGRIEGEWKDVVVLERPLIRARSDWESVI
ncbi:MAG: GNAT family N-acetyltransferase [Solirubrobacterales bacterium]